VLEIDLSGKRAWVTGGSRGIGRATCLALARAGCDVAVGFHSAATAADAVVAEVVALGRRAIAVGGDLGQVAAREAAHQRIASELGHVDILVNNAGAIRDKLFLLLDESDWSSVIDANLMSTVNATRTAVRAMWPKRAGKIINISSVAATRGGAGQSNYVATKAAIEGITRSLAVEFGARKITVNCIAPGVIETEMSEALIASSRAGLLERQIIKRFGAAHEIAAWVVWLASAHADFVSGQVFHVDGGLKMA
jgi:3-oxoacyl-[acyl-carrier protein] reductase